jgi:flavin reductase (DIM6/NTAB) family NADH-FMN oxidoreductase RutF
MRHFSREDLDNLERRFRANLLNCATGFKSANLVGTASADGSTNLAVFNSAVHIGADPPLIALIFRPLGEVDRHTYDNIKSTGVYTLNHVPAVMARNAHVTSAKVPRAVSEFGACGFTEQRLDGFGAPFVLESRVKIGLRFVEETAIRLNGTTMLIGQVEHLIVSDGVLGANGNIDLVAAGSACITGLDTYHTVLAGDTYPYAKPEHAEDLRK